MQHILQDAFQKRYGVGAFNTTEVVKLAHQHGVAVEGELEAGKGVEDGMGSDDAGEEVPLDQALAFVRAAKIDSFAPAIGTAHGVYRTEPRINFQRVADMVAAEPIPIVLHGGTGLKTEVFQELIRRGAVKVNISTNLKITYTDGLRNHLNAKPTQHDPAKLHDAVKQQVQAMAADYRRIFGSAGKAP